MTSEFVFERFIRTVPKQRQSAHHRTYFDAFLQGSPFRIGVGPEWFTPDPKSGSYADPDPGVKIAAGLLKLCYRNMYVIKLSSVAHSESGIRDPVPFDPGSGSEMENIPIEILSCDLRIRDLFDAGSGIWDGKIWIRKKRSRIRNIVIKIRRLH